jgi:hypothetical protein
MPPRTQAHQLLNIRQSEGFKDQKQLVLHTVLLASSTHYAPWHKCGAFAFVPTGKVCASVSMEHPMQNVLLVVLVYAVK